MKSPGKNKAAGGHETGSDPFGELRHDINNQLSNILLALEQLRYEIPNASVDCLFYLDAISVSSEKINALLKSGSPDPDSYRDRKSER
jgi:hypothetical protein